MTREELINHIKYNLEINTDVFLTDEDAKMVIKALEQPKTGYWKQISPAKIYECSLCGQTVMTNDIVCYRYCHGCGEKMENSDADSD